MRLAGYAGGRLGRHIVGGLLGRGHVGGFIHNSNVLAPREQLELVRGDVQDSAGMGNAIHGVDAVISALSSAAAPSGLPHRVIRG